MIYPIVSEFGKWVRENREKRGWSLRQLENRINKACTFGYLGQLEKDVRGKKGNPLRPDIEIVDALAAAFDADVDEARMLAGYAPKNIPTFHPPETLGEFLAILEQLGVELQNFHAPPFDESPEFYHGVLRDLSQFLMFKLFTPPSRTFTIGDDEEPKLQIRRDSPPVAHFPKSKAG